MQRRPFSKKRGREMLSRLRNQDAGVMVLVAVSMVVLLGFTALAIDVGHLLVARNELQNAADAGALAGAQELYNDNGTVIDTGANQIGFDVARANNSDQAPVDVNWSPGDNVGSDVERGHWSFGLAGSLSPRGFYPSDSTTVIALPGLSDAELDGYDGLVGRPVFINAVRVVARRQASGTPIVSFFARILGYESFELSAEAVAYRGFAGTLLPKDLDFPIAICEDSIINGECTIGRMINSGLNAASHGTGGWTDMNQDDACSGGTSAPPVRNLIACDGKVNDYMLKGGEPLSTIGGQVQSAFDDLLEIFIDPDPPHTNCASNPVFDADGDEIGRALIDFDGPDGIPDGIPDVPWEITVPRISCPDNNVGPCETLTGAITIEVVWILGSEEGWVDHDPDPDEPKNGQMVDTNGDGIVDTNMLTPNYIVPDHMGNWPTPAELAAIPDFYTNAKARWASFLDHFQLQNLDGSPAPFDQKSIYFHPVCEQRDLAGVSGGKNYGVLAKIPVLVD